MNCRFRAICDIGCSTCGATCFRRGLVSKSVNFRHLPARGARRMPAPTDTEKINKLVETVATLNERVTNLREEVKELKKQLEEEKKRKSSLVSGVTGAVVGALVGASTTFLLRRLGQ